MMLNYLTAIWSEFAAAMGNHLWQSTLFAVAAGLLTLVLRKNHARARYWLWLAASVKFLIPFSLLVGLGSHLAWTSGSMGTKAGVYIAMEEFGQPFAQTTMPVVSRTAPPTALASLIHLLPAIVVDVWLCGFVAVLFVWYARWRRVSASVRESMALREGREVEALRRVERGEGIRKPIELLLSRTSVEPGIFGIAQPVLVWPEGISARLEDAHLEAILAHEVCHVQRRDNLAAAIHMLVEAIFWFYPLVWWLGARLVEERERACDEEVLASGTHREVYAESILKICEFCVGSPLACVSGVTGADLKKRIARIMTQGVARKLDFSRKLLLSAAGVWALALPIAFGLLHATQSRAASQDQHSTTDSLTYATVLVKPTEPVKSGESRPFPTRMLSHPGEFSATDVTLAQLIRTVYGVEENQISGGPDWLGSSKFDVEAKMDKSVLDQMNALSPDQCSTERSRMLQAILADHFKLTLHHETKDLPVYVMVVAKSGPKLREATSGDTYPSGFKGLDGRPAGADRIFSNTQEGRGQIIGQGLNLSEFAAYLSMHVHTKVLDKTGLTTRYDFTLKWTPNDSQSAMFAAIQEELGLNLEPQTAPMDVLVIDHAEKPAELQSQNTIETAPRLEVVSIKPNKTGDPMAGFEVIGRPSVAIWWSADRFMATNLSLHMLIQIAYDVQSDQIVGGPEWINSEKYDVDTKIDAGAGQGNLDRPRMFRELLTDRFQLALHRETKETPVYALVFSKRAPNLQEAKPGDTYANGCQGRRPCGVGLHLDAEKNEVVGQGLPISSLVSVLSQNLGGHIVLDKTALTGKYDFTLRLPPNASRELILAAVQEQLGLRLQPQTARTEVLVVDNAARPLEN